MKITKTQLKQIIKEGLKRSLLEVREFKPSQQEGSFVLKDDGVFELTLELSGRTGAMTTAVVEGQLNQDSMDMLMDLANKS